jgi:y4mF family transcriptional regulator
MYTPEEIGRMVRQTRMQLGLTQEQLALASGMGRRFIIELEQGKPTCQLGRALAVLQALGIRMTLATPLGEPGTQPADR